MQESNEYRLVHGIGGDQHSEIEPFLKCQHRQVLQRYKFFSLTESILYQCVKQLWFASDCLCYHRKHASNICMMFLPVRGLCPEFCTPLNKIEQKLRMTGIVHHLSGRNVYALATTPPPNPPPQSGGGPRGAGNAPWLVLRDPTPVSDPPPSAFHKCRVACI